MHDSDEAVQALAAMRGSRMRLAEKDTPPSRHLAFAALLGSIVLSPALPLVLRGALIVAVIVGLFAIKRWDERRTGMFINGYRRGRTRWVTAMLLVVWGAIYALAYWSVYARGTIWPVPLLALGATAIAYRASLLWCRVFSAEMAAG